jgi:putative nucleotidyltransferase with HDIG domain
MADKRIALPVSLLTLFAASLTVFVFVQYTPDFSPEWFLALGVLLLLGVASTSLAFRVTEKGSTTDVNYLLELGAVLLLGAPGATTLACLSGIISQGLIQRKPWVKASFNVAQYTIAAAIAGLLYHDLGGTSTLIKANFDFGSSVVPFLAASGSYFLINSLSVTTIISYAEKLPFHQVWKRIAGVNILVDIVSSPLAFLIPWLFYWNVAAVFLAIVPIIGLRYSYGINIELQQLNRDLLRALVKTLEAQDPYTSGHSIRVAERSRAIAEELGLSSRKVRLIETGALLHDIGKIGTEFSRILRQKGPLTPSQRELIRSHPERGVEIIEPIRRLDPVVLDCVRHHHERVDGTGYPSGLAGDDIPLGARVIMVADTIDAMLTARPYRDALPVEVVQDELRRHTGTQFDIRMVEAALRAGVIQEVEVDTPASLQPSEAIEEDQPSDGVNQYGAASSMERAPRMGIGGS